MLIRAALIASLVFLSTSVAGAVITWTTSASSASGRPLSGLQIGDVVTIDVTLRSDGETTLGVGGAASGYDDTIVGFTSGDASTAILVSVCIPASGCFGGLDNLAANQTLAQNDTNPAGPFVQYQTSVSVTGVTNTGASDEGVITSVAGDPQYRLIFTALAEGSTTIDIGAIQTFGNALILQGGAQGTSNNTTVPLTVPEPGAIASSLAALGSVFAVVGIRRRG